MPGHRIRVVLPWVAHVISTWAAVMPMAFLLACAPRPRESSAARPSLVTTDDEPPEGVSDEGALADAAPEPPPPHPEFMELSVTGFRPAVVALPASMSRPRPALVAAHGAGDGPKWQCALWRELLEARAFVLCPAGVPFGKTEDEGFFYRNHYELEQEVLAGVEALRAAFPKELDGGPMLYAGYSQGATMGALMLVNHGELFPRLALIEGGYSEWSVSLAKKFASGGGERVLFACGISSCNTKAERSKGWVERAGLKARLEYAPGAGHTYGGAVATKVFHALDWLLEGDDRWH